MIIKITRKNYWNYIILNLRMGSFQIWAADRNLEGNPKYRDCTVDGISRRGFRKIWIFHWEAIELNE